LHFDGFPEDTISNAYQKFAIEKERLAIIQNPNHVDTFEKFIEFGEEEEFNPKRKPALFSTEVKHC